MNRKTVYLMATVALVLTTSVMSGCGALRQGGGGSWRGGGASDSNIPMASGDYPYDGTWVGVAKRTEDLGRCGDERMGLRFTIKKGSLDGTARRGDDNANLNGAVAKDGQVLDVMIPGRYRAEDYLFQGKFTKDEGSGTWSSKNCKGEWQAARTN